MCDEEGRGVVIGDGNHFAQRAVDLGAEFSLPIGFGHEEKFDQRRRVEGEVAVVIGANRSVGLGEIDDAEREVVGGQPGKIFQRSFGRAGYLCAQLGIHRQGFEFAEVGAGGRCDREECDDK
jgi:hypothetical protein